MSGGSFLAAYRQRLADGALLEDPAQAAAAERLDRLERALAAPAPPAAGSGWFRRKEAEPAAPRGLYLHGGPGRGKSMLMDLFFAAVPEAAGKRRVHFHAFMIEVHDFIHARRKAGEAGVDSALPALAAALSAQLRLLCLDEFLVTDVADAMILGRLFTALFEAGLVVVTTSNSAPEDLYRDGLQRDRFVPFIALIRETLDVVALDGPTDYRTLHLEKAGTYFWPLGPEATARAEALFARLAGRGPYESPGLEVKGRTLVVPRSAHGIAWFRFADLCETPRGAEDFLKIAEAFHTVFLEGVPALGYDRRNEARRFILLIDILYDKGVQLVMTAAAPPADLYRGHDHAFEFSRTISRLNEMQTAHWIERRDASWRIHA